MRLFSLIVLFALVIKVLPAQVPTQVFAGHEATEFNFMWNGYLDKKEKFTLFNFTFFETDYNEQSNNTYEIYQVIIYNLNKKWGVAGGGRFIANEFISEAALSFQAFGKDLYLNLFPSVRYTPSLEEAGYSVFGMVIYTPKLNDKWSFFNQVIFEPLFNNEGHVFSYQQLRIGLGYRSAFQFGLGANLSQVGDSFENETNLGVFVRKEL